MAINFGDILGGLGAAYGGRAQEYAEGIRQREQGLTEQKRVELEARQRAMYEDADTALGFLMDDSIPIPDRANQIIQLAEDRLDALSSYPDADPSDTLQILRDAQAMRDQSDPMAINRLATTLFPAASIYRQRFAPQQEQERGVVVGGNLVGQNTGRLIYQAPPQTPQEPAAVQSLRIRAAESGLIPGTPEYSDFMRSGGGGAGQVINVGTGGANEGSPALNKIIDEQAAAYINAASSSSSLGRDLSILGQLAPLTTQGAIPAAISSIYPGYNDANTAFTGIVSQALPKLRVPGSGAQSDKDIDVLTAGFGKLQPSNQTKMLLIEAMNAKNQIDQERADVATQYATQQIDRSQYLRAIRAIDNQSIIPPALQSALNMVIPGGAQSSIPQSAIDAGVSPDEWSNMTPEQRGVFP